MDWLDADKLGLDYDMKKLLVQDLMEFDREAKERDFVAGGGHEEIALNDGQLQQPCTPPKAHHSVRVIDVSPASSNHTPNRFQIQPPKYLHGLGDTEAILSGVFQFDFNFNCGVCI